MWVMEALLCSADFKGEGRLGIFKGSTAPAGDVNVSCFLCSMFYGAFCCYQGKEVVCAKTNEDHSLFMK